MIEESAPESAYFAVSAESEGVVFPFTRYPKRLHGGSPTAILLCDLDILNSEEFKMFYATTTLSQFGRFVSQRAHTHVVFARKPYWKWCSENLVEMAKENNKVLWRDGNMCTYSPFLCIALIDT